MVRFTGIDRLLVLGGQPFCVRISGMARDKGLDVRLVAARRNVEGALVDGLPWEQGVERAGIPYILADDVDSPPVDSLVTTTTLGLSHGAPWIFRKPFIDRFAGRLLNYHPTPLPLYRGGATHSWRILMGDRQGAFTIHYVDQGIDTGDILRMEPFLYPEGLRVPADYFGWEYREGMAFLGRFLDDVLAGAGFSPFAQRQEDSTYFPRLNTNIHAAVDWSWKAEQVGRFICAFDEPYPGAFSFIGQRKVRLKDCCVAGAGTGFHPFQQGLVVRRDGPAAFVACVDGLLRVGRFLDDATGQEIAPALGDRLHTPVAELERARISRVVYTPSGMKVLG